MPARMQKLGTGALVLVATCETCGRPANFGDGVNMRQAIEAKDGKLAGRWFCGWRDGRPACVKPDALDEALGDADARRD